MDNKIFSKFNSFLERTLIPIGVKVSGQRHMKAIRDGMIAATPLSIVGGFFLIIGSPPVNPAVVQPTNFLNKFLLGWYNFAKVNGEAIELPFNMSMALMGFFIAISIAYNLAKEYDLNPLSSCINSAVVFFLVSAPSTLAVKSSNIISEALGSDIIAKQSRFIPVDYMDAKGVFTAMIIAIGVVEITRFLKNKKIEIRMPESVPSAIAASFSAIIPLFISVILFYGGSLLIQNFTGKLIPQVIMDAMSPLVIAVDSPLGIVLIAVITQLLWLVGLHGASIVSGVVGVFESSNLVTNGIAMEAGEAILPHIYSTPFRAFFMIIGGSGATLALIFLIMRSKSAHLRTIGKLSLIPGLFNINEPIIFGLPLVLNPVLAIPFVLVQAINGLIAYFLMSNNFISRTFASVPWTTPAPIGGFLSTMDWRAGLLIIGLIILDMILYYPFVKVYEKQVLAEEKNSNKIVS